MKENRVPIVQQGYIDKTADWLMQPIMYWLQGNRDELPQRTHFWNNQKFKREDLDWLEVEKMIMSPADPEAVDGWKFSLLPIFHAPRLGGWKQYTVLQPISPVYFWHVGWLSPAVCGISQVALSSAVKVLRGNVDCLHFGIDTQGYQIPLKKIGAGTIGDKRWVDIPLL